MIKIDIFAENENTYHFRSFLRVVVFLLILTVGIPGNIHAQMHLNEAQLDSAEKQTSSVAYKNGFYISEGTTLRGEQYIYHQTVHQKLSKKKAKTGKNFAVSMKSKSKKKTENKRPPSQASRSKPNDFPVIIQKDNNQRINVGNNEKVCAVTSGNGTIKFILNNNINILFSKRFFFKNLKISTSSILIQDCHLTYLSIRPPPGNLT